MKIPHLLSIGLFLFASSALFSQTNEATIETTKLSDNVYMLVGSGGNIGVSAGEVIS